MGICMCVCVCVCGSMARILSRARSALHRVVPEREDSSEDHPLLLPEPERELELDSSLEDERGRPDDCVVSEAQSTKSTQRRMSDH